MFTRLVVQLYTLRPPVSVDYLITTLFVSTIIWYCISDANVRLIYVPGGQYEHSPLLLNCPYSQKRPLTTNGCRSRKVAVSLDSIFGVRR